MNPIIVVVILVVVGGGLFIASGMRAVNRLPDNHPAAFLQKGRAPSTKTLVVCAGDSITHATVSGDYVAMLRERFGGQGCEFVNAGLNGHLAYNLLQRLDDIIACKPDVVTILIGTNDVNATYNDARAKTYIRDFKLPQTPTQDWYRENLDTILTRLKNETSAKLAILSLPVLGEDRDSAINQRIIAYNGVIQELADKHGAAYLPLHERLTAMLDDKKRQPRLRYDGRLWLVYMATVRRYALGQSWDTVSERNGFYVLTDHIHLNDRSAQVIVELVGEVLAEAVSQEAIVA